jgi:crotonobetaine/carnitine-CoA ligase
MFAINYLGAVCVPLNLSYRGGVFEHVVNDCGGRFMFADSRLLDRLDEIETNSLETLIVVGEPDHQPAGYATIPVNSLYKQGSDVPPPARPIEPWDTEFVLYTSGTTGPSKGALSSYTHRFAQAWATACLHPGDRRYVHGPLSHTAGAGAIYTTLCKGGSIALAESFKTDRFWGHIAKFKPQMTALLGATIPFLLKAPPSPDDKNHGLRAVMVAPVDENAIRFGKRFGVEIYGIYSMTEMSVPLWCGPDVDRVGQCGNAPRPGVEVRIVDESDIPVADGQSGELIVRCDDPWVMMHGYLNNPAATAKAWANGWFHTGDMFRRDPDGEYIFMDRIKDVVRRRGENISSFEVETAMSLYPGVREVAIVAARSELSEDEILAIVSPVPGATIDPADLLEFLRPKLPHFMIPRYFRIVEDLPRTSTAKIMKTDLRAEGITPDTWDREAHGITVKAARL